MAFSQQLANDSQPLLKRNAPPEGPAGRFVLLP
jgi:hypothetical protein